MLDLSDMSQLMEEVRFEQFVRDVYAQPNLVNSACSVSVYASENAIAFVWTLGSRIVLNGKTKF